MQILTSPAARRPASRAGRRTTAAGRAATMIEFAFVLPIFLFMMLFTVDMGSLMLMSGAMNDAAYGAARAGAQVGGGAIDPVSGSRYCDSYCTAGAASESWNQALEQVPFADHMWSAVDGVYVTSGGVCSSSGPNTFVTVRTHYALKLLTPGLTSMLNLMDGEEAGLRNQLGGDSGVAMTATGVARCEIFRTP